MMPQTSGKTMYRARVMAVNKTNKARFRKKNINVKAFIVDVSSP
jgi:hypothetical protein